MPILKNREGKIVVKLWKDFTRDYNANSLSKEIHLSPRGTLKILKKLEHEGILVGKKLGKAVFYKTNVKDNYVAKIIETLLMAEAREKSVRWLEEFKEIYKETKIVVLFGSATRNLKEAKDIDIIIVYEQKKNKKIQEYIAMKNKIMVKQIHDIPQTIQDLKENLKKRNPAIIDAIRTGYVLHGQDKLIEVLNHVASVETR